MPLSHVNITVTRRRQVAIPVDQAERLKQLQHHQMAEDAHQTAVDHAMAAEPAMPEPAQGVESEPTPSGKPLKREANALQSTFLAANLNCSVTVFLMNGIKLIGRLRQYDQFTVLLEGPDGVNSLTFKYTINTLQPVNRT